MANNGNVRAIANLRDPSRTQRFAYDELNRIAIARTDSTTGENAWGQSFSYDRWGNLFSVTVTQGTAPMLSVTVDNKNRITNRGFTYDAAGNLTKDGNGPGTYTYQWDGESRMKSVDNGSTGAYTYDGDGRRVKKASGKLYWYSIGGEVLTETDLSGNNPTEYIFLNGKRMARGTPNGEINFYLADHLGSSRVVTDADGNILDDSDFYPFGGERVVQSSSGNTYRFTGKERDPGPASTTSGRDTTPACLGDFPPLTHC